MLKCSRSENRGVNNRVAVYTYDGLPGYTIEIKDSGGLIECLAEGVYEWVNRHGTQVSNDAALIAEISRRCANLAIARSTEAEVPKDNMDLLTIQQANPGADVSTIKIGSLYWTKISVSGEDKPLLLGSAPTAVQSLNVTAHHFTTLASLYSH